jgi:hypothetical protein
MYYEKICPYAHLITEIGITVKAAVAGVGACGWQPRKIFAAYATHAVEGFSWRKIPRRHPIRIFGNH